ncbi:response regulator [Nitriliruptor alkaliphilus]|uniref:response regulator n=1 Tax=Nitriliruptor alkaliphilus TaxID=427918 RepID=UPI000696BFBF|nr:response regulator [Nitriliruptor alkaliphilus]
MSNTQPALRVGVCDDDPAFRGLVRRVLEDHVDLVGVVATGDDAVDLVTETKPDVLLLDVLLSGESGIEVIPRLLRAGPTTMLAALSGLDAERWEQEVLVAGAFVYYEKTTILELPDLLPTDVALFRRALAGEDVLAPSALRRRRVERDAPLTGPDAPD